MKRALRSNAKPKDFAAAARLLISTFERVRFGLAAKCRSKPEYALLMRHLDLEERAAFAPLYAKTVEFLQGQQSAK
jgi:hypothetical protein